MKVGFIGGGKMGEAIVAALVHSRIVTPHDLFVVEIDEERRRLLKRRHGVSVFADVGLMLGIVDIVFLAIKPQDLDALLERIAADVRPDQLVISIAAGKRLEGIERLLPANTRVVRVMPNLPAVIAEAMCAFCTGQAVTDDDRRIVVTLLSCVGHVVELPEDAFDAVTAVSGSGPAFFAYFMQLVVDAGAALGLDAKSATLLAEQTMLGTAMLLAKGEYTAEELIAAVSSKKGTTVAGLAVLRESAMGDIVRRTLEAAANRSRELSQ